MLVPYTGLHAGQKIRRGNGSGEKRGMFVNLGCRKCQVESPRKAQYIFKWNMILNSPIMNDGCGQFDRTFAGIRTYSTQSGLQFVIETSSNSHCLVRKVIQCRQIAAGLNKALVAFIDLGSRVAKSYPVSTDSSRFK